MKEAPRPRCPAKLNGDPPPTCRLEEGHDGDHESVQPHGILSWNTPVAEIGHSVLRPEEFARNFASWNHGVTEKLDWRIFKLMRAYAEALLKSHESLHEELRQARERITQLEGK